MFSAATKQEFKENVSNIKQRLRIQQLVLAGKIGEAIQLTQRLYPDVLNDNPNLHFALKCRQFIEMIAAGAIGDQKLLNHNSPHSCSSASSSPATNGATPSSNSSSELNGNSTNDHMDVDDDYSNGSSDGANLKSIIQFGKELHQWAQTLKKQHGSNEHNKKMLQEAFSLMAYSDPRSSPVGYQLNAAERENVCQQLNTAIVIHEMGSSNHRPPLETIIKHSKSLLRLNGQSGAWLLEQL